MAYTIVSSQFQPFNYDQYMQPLTQATQAQQDVENQYSTLQQQSTAAHAYVNPNDSPIAYGMYNDYNTQLQNSMNDVMQNGLNPSSRQALMQVKQQFNNNIVPIEQAVQTKLNNINTYNSMVRSDPSLLLSQNPSNVSVDAYLKNPNMSIDSISGNQLTSKISAIASAYAKAHQNVAFNPVLNGQQYEEKITQGYTPDQIMQAVQGNAPKELQQALNNVWSENNLDKYSPDVQQRAMKYMLDGLYGGLQTTTSNLVTNKAWDKQAELSTQEALAKYNYGLDINKMNYQQQLQNQASSQQNQVDAQGRFPIIPAHLTSPSLDGGEGQKLTTNLANMLGINMLNGKFALSQQGTYGSKFSGLEALDGGVPNAGTMRYSLWNPDGTMKTRNQFIRQAGGNSTKQAALSEMYNNINTQFSNLGIQTPDAAAKNGKVWTAASVSQQLRRAYSGNGAMGMDVLRLGNDANGASMMGTVIASTQKGNYLNNVHAITSFDNSGNMKVDPAQVKVSDFTDDKGKINGNPMFYVSPNQHIGGYILVNNGKKYFVDGKAMGLDMNMSNQLGDEQSRFSKMKDSYLRANGRQALNSPHGQAINNYLNNAGAAYLRNALGPFTGVSGMNAEDIITNEKQTP